MATELPCVAGLVSGAPVQRNSYIWKDGSGTIRMDASRSFRRRARLRRTAVRHAQQQSLQLERLLIKPTDKKFVFNPSAEPFMPDWIDVDWNSFVFSPAADEMDYGPGRLGPHQDMNGDDGNSKSSFYNLSGRLCVEELPFDELHVLLDASITSLVSCTLATEAHLRLLCTDCQANELEDPGLDTSKADCEALEVECRNRMTIMMQVQDRIVAGVAASSDVAGAASELLADSELNLQWLDMVVDGQRLQADSSVWKARDILRDRIIQQKAMLTAATAATRTSISS